MNPQAKRLRSKLGWLSEEQDLIQQLVEGQMQSWKCICEVVNSKFPERKRNPKQCRQRYNNYIKFQKKERNTSGWDTFEQAKLIELYHRFGSKWTEISNQLHDRSPNEVKNKFYGSIRRLIRKINDFLKEQQLKLARKPISYQTLLRLLSTDTNMEREDDPEAFKKIQFIKNLKERILHFASNNCQNIQQIQACRLVQQLVKFNIMTRADRLRELKGSKKQKKTRKRRGGACESNAQTEKSAKSSDMNTLGEIQTTNKDGWDKRMEVIEEELRSQFLQRENSKLFSGFDSELNRMLGIQKQCPCPQFLEYL